MCALLSRALAQLAVTLHFGLVVQFAHLFQTQELGVQGKGRVGVVGVGVLPRVGHRGVIDRKNLNNRLTGRGGPIDHQHQVVELTHTEALIGAECKDRNGHTGTTPGGAVEAGTQGIDQHRTFRRHGLCEVVVFAQLPAYHLARLTLYDDELVHKGELELVGLQVGTPYGEVGIAHLDGLLYLPLAQRLGIAHQHHLLVGTHLGNLGTDDHLANADGLLLGTLRTGKDTLGEHRRVERTIGGHLLPTVVDVERRELLVEGQTVRCAPFGTERTLVVAQLVVIDEFLRGGFEGALPQITTDVLHRVALLRTLLGHHVEVFTIGGTVLDS